LLPLLEARRADAKRVSVYTRTAFCDGRVYILEYRKRGRLEGTDEGAK
jgi:hypothetical protein